MALKTVRFDGGPGNFLYLSEAEFRIICTRSIAPHKSMQKDQDRKKTGRELTLALFLKEELTRHVLLNALETETNRGKAGLNERIPKKETGPQELNCVLASLYRDKDLGNLSEIIFQSLLEQYESELSELNSGLPKLQKEQQAFSSRNGHVTNGPTQYNSANLEFGHLDNELARGLIDSIVVSGHRDWEKIPYRKSLTALSATSTLF